MMGIRVFMRSHRFINDGVQIDLYPTHLIATSAFGVNLVGWVVDMVVFLDDDIF